MALVDFTSHDEVRAVLGISDDELEDSTLSLPVYEFDLKKELREVSSDLLGTYATVSSTPPEDRSDAEEQLYEAVRLFSTYAVARHLCTGLANMSPKEMTDSKASFVRYAAGNIEAITSNVEQRYTLFKSNLQHGDLNQDHPGLCSECGTARQPGDQRMKLGRVAQRFNKTPCMDAYTGELAFMCQLAPYDDSRRDSVTIERRVLSVGPDAEIPWRRTVDTPQGRFIIGADQPDTFNGKLIRRSLIAQTAPFEVRIKTLAQVCLGQSSVLAYGNLLWLKNLAYTSQTSTLVPEYQVFLAAGEPVDPGCVLQIDLNLYFVRAIDAGAAGMLVLVVEQLPAGALADATVSVSEFDKIHGVSSSTDVDAQALRLRWQSLYQYGNKLAPAYGPDEQVTVLAKSQVPSLPTGSKIHYGSEVWAISAIDGQMDDVWVCRTVRHV